MVSHCKYIILINYINVIVFTHIACRELTGQPSRRSSSGLLSAARYVFAPLFTAIEWPQAHIKKESGVSD